MEKIKGKSPAMSIIVRILTLGMLIIHFLMVALDVRGQAIKQTTSYVPESPFSSVHTKRNKVRQIYNSQIGVREKQPNSGTQVENYLKYVNLPAGNPWCAAFVCWVYGRAGVVNPQSGWSPALFGEGRIIWDRGEGRVSGIRDRESSIRYQVSRCGAINSNALSSSNFDGITLAGRCAYSPQAQVGGKFCTHVVPATGDVFGLYFPEKGRIAHVGFIDEWNDPWVITVEGNTNVLGGREGDGVYRKRRLVRTVDRVARYVN